MVECCSTTGGGCCAQGSGILQIGPHPSLQSKAHTSQIDQDWPLVSIGSSSSFRIITITISQQWLSAHCIEPGNVTTFSWLNPNVKHCVNKTSIPSWGLLKNRQSYKNQVQIREIFNEQVKISLCHQDITPSDPPPPHVFWKLNLWLAKQILHLVPSKNSKGRGGHQSSHKVLLSKLSQWL